MQLCNKITYYHSIKVIGAKRVNSAFKILQKPLINRNTCFVHSVDDIIKLSTDK